MIVSFTGSLEKISQSQVSPISPVSQTEVTHLVLLHFVLVALAKAGLGHHLFFIFPSWTARSHVLATPMETLRFFQLLRFHPPLPPDLDTYPQGFFKSGDTMALQLLEVSGNLGLRCESHSYPFCSSTLRDSLLLNLGFFRHKMNNIEPNPLEGSCSLGSLHSFFHLVIPAPPTSGLLLFEKNGDLGMDSMTSWFLRKML